MRNKTIPYSPHLKEYARHLRNNSTLPEILLWQNIKRKALKVEFHRQVPMLDYIVDFYCHELMLAIEIDGNSHDFKYNYDAKRQGQLEAYGVQFIRFTNTEIKQEMFSVLLAIQQTIDTLKTSPNNSPFEGGPRGM